MSAVQRVLPYVVLVMGVLPRGFGIDRAGAVEVEKRVVHRHAACRRRSCKRTGNLGRLALADEVADGGRDHHELACERTAHAIAARKQLLREHGYQARRELHADLALQTLGKHVDDAVDRIGC